MEQEVVGTNACSSDKSDIMQHNTFNNIMEFNDDIDAHTMLNQLGQLENDLGSTSINELLNNIKDVSNISSLVTKASLKKIKDQSGKLHSKFNGKLNVLKSTKQTNALKLFLKKKKQQNSERKQKKNQNMFLKNTIATRIKTRN